jgi:HK97 family phage prohead protease
MANIDWSAWDASKAWSAGSKSDNPAAFYRAICAGRKSGDPSKQSAWALPYRYSPTSPINAAGVRAANQRLSQTDGLTNKAQAQSKLERLMTQVQAAEKNRSALDMEVRAYRAENAEEIPGGDQRRIAYPAELRGNFKKVNGRTVYEIDGYATVFEKGYRMWDRAGEYTETMDTHSLDLSLAHHPDVAFLVNHKGVTMARTRSGNGRPPTMILAADSTGMNVRAMLNAERTDVKDLAHAIDDGDVDEMSFAFMIEKSEWNEEFTQFRITQANIDRGDVSAVNFGANPYTTIMARASEIMRDLENLPPAVQRAAVVRLFHHENSDLIFESEVVIRDAVRQLQRRYDEAGEFNIDAAARAVENLDQDDLADLGRGEVPTERAKTATDWATHFERLAGRKTLRHRLQGEK